MTHVPSESRYNHGCSCDGCRAAHTRYKRAQRWEHMAERVLVDGHLIHPSAPHGTRNGYGFYGCRCSSCRAINTQTLRDYRRRRAAEKP